LSLTEIKGESLRVPDVTKNDFILALQKSKKSVGKDQLGEYERWTKEFGQDGWNIFLIIYRIIKIYSNSSK